MAALRWISLISELLRTDSVLSFFLADVQKALLGRVKTFSSFDISFIDLENLEPPELANHKEGKSC